jgi:DNA/RNA endonuclease YhcR with UshA esterase domain
MKYLLTILLALFFNAASAQKIISLEEAKDHIGDSVSVSGKVFGVKYFSEGKQAPTLINVGAAFPNQLLTVVIYGEDRERLKLEPETMYRDKQLLISGRVELYRGKPQIIVRDAAQLVIQE